MGVLGFIKDVQGKGIVGAATKEANRLGVMPKGSTLKTLGQMKNVAMSVNRGLMAVGMGSKNLNEAFNMVDKAGDKIQKVNEASKAIASGDPTAIASAARSGAKFVRNKRNQRG